jgi:hypothetical protein
MANTSSTDRGLNVNTCPRLPNRLGGGIDLPPPEDGEQVAGEALTEFRKRDLNTLMVEQDFKEMRRASVSPHY